MTVPIVTPSMQARARILLKAQTAWLRGRSLKTDASFWIIAGRTSAHYTTSSGCTCKSFEHRGVCSHAVAVQLHEQRQAQPAPKRASYADPFEACRDCGDLADGLDGRCCKCASDREWEACHAW
jgi:hypothetical protein